jgi:hypothetical protein
VDRIILGATTRDWTTAPGPLRRRTPPTQTRPPLSQRAGCWASSHITDKTLENQARDMPPTPKQTNTTRKHNRIRPTSATVRPHLTEPRTIWRHGPGLPGDRPGRPPCVDRAVQKLGDSTVPKWPLPNTSIRGQVPLNHRAAIRRLAHTLMLDLGSEIDANPLPARRREMMRWAQVTCPGNCDGTDFIRTPGGLCGSCSHLKRTDTRHTNKDTSTCPCCNKSRISAVEGPSKHPCLVCTSTWILETNPFAARLATETATPPTPDTTTDTLPTPNREATACNILDPPGLPRGEFLYATWHPWFDPDTTRKLEKALNRIQREMHTDELSGID